MYRSASAVHPWGIDGFDDPLQALAAADPVLRETVQAGIDRCHGCKPDKDLLRSACGFILWAVSRQVRLGLDVAKGVAALLSASHPRECIRRYRERVLAAHGTGPEMAGLIARGMPSVLKNGADADLAMWESTIHTLSAKGTYALYGPLTTIGLLYDRSDMASAQVSMELLQRVFSRELTYNRSRHLLHLICRGIERMKPSKRMFQLRQADRIAAIDADLLDAFFEGLEAGLHRLNASGLSAFVNRAIEGRCENPGVERPLFLSLSSENARTCFDELLVSATLDEQKDRLQRYMKARMSKPMTLTAMDERIRSGQGSEGERLVLSGSDTVYLAEEIDEASSRSANEAIYRTLLRLELGFHEFGTYDFDWIAFSAEAGFSAGKTGEQPQNRSDLEMFFQHFGHPLVAEKLFSLIELSRIRFHSDRLYPGIFRAAQSILAEKLSRTGGSNPPSLAERLYRFLVLRQENMRPQECGMSMDPIRLFSEDASVEQTARLTQALYPFMEKDGSRPFVFPYGWKPSPRLVYQGRNPIERVSERLQQMLLRQGIRIRRSELCRWIEDPKRQIHSIRIESANDSQTADERSAEATLRALMCSSIRSEDIVFPNGSVDPSEGVSFRYPEWDVRASDYLPDHVRIIVHEMGTGETKRYESALLRYAGLVSGIRRAFEMMRPMGMDIRRGWMEGDTFDYPLLIDWAVSRKVKAEGPQRLYIHRIKNKRDVVVLLLVDLSRSTAHPVEGHPEGLSVVDVETDAVVLFCEALATVGDRFAICGFSGNGRHCVDYYRVKGFDEPIDATVRSRIGALRPYRSTRMGAAVRHATAELAAQDAAVRLMIVLGDGFPNDVDYKREYAVSDTRKAVQEARSKGIHVHAVTVNIAADPLLDDMYGWNRHTVISDVTELPEKLVRIYSRLTKG